MYGPMKNENKQIKTLISVTLKIITPKNYNTKYWIFTCGKYVGFFRVAKRINTSGDSKFTHGSKQKTI